MKKVHWYIIAVLTVALIFTTFVNFNQAKGANAKYEYKIVQLGSWKTAERELNMAVQDGDGWRVIDVDFGGDSSAAYLEREIK